MKERYKRSRNPKSKKKYKIANGKEYEKNLWIERMKLGKQKKKLMGKSSHHQR